MKKRLIIIIAALGLAVLLLAHNFPKGKGKVYSVTQLDLIPNIANGLNLIPLTETDMNMLDLAVRIEEEHLEKSGQIITVYDSERGVMELEIEDYLVHVVAGEMPASFEEEALKAQAVAARTFTEKRITGSSKCKSGCDVCTNPGCCQAFAFTTSLERAWGENFEKYYEKIVTAVSSTRGEVIVNDGKLIAALYHSSSGGMTENSEEVFAVALPYLVSVVSEGEEKQGGYSSERLIPNDVFIDTVNSAYPEAELADPAADIDIWGRTESGRVKLVQIGKTVISSQQFRALFGLHSTNFTFEFTENAVKITCLGYGHGVGMSQCGANAMAKRGCTYREILMHYYTGVYIASWEDIKA